MRIKIGLLLLLLSSVLLISCSNENKNEQADIRDASQKEKLAEESEKEKIEKEKIEAEKQEAKFPEESQAVSELPWDEDEDFNNAIKENDTDVLIAGFSTVFEDVSPEEHVNIELAANTINKTVVMPGEVFSQNETAGPYTEDKGYLEGIGYAGGEVIKDIGGGVCNVATTLYNTSIASDLDIVERHNHSMPVPYVPYGQDAAVAYGYKDFKFKNNTEHPMLIWTELIDNRLFMGFYGKEAAPEITWEHETLSETKTSTRYQTNSDLEKGEENVLIDGMDGKVVESILKIKDKNGEERIKEIGKSSYNPMMNIIEKNE